MRVWTSGAAFLLGGTCANRAAESPTFAACSLPGYQLIGVPQAHGVSKLLEPFQSDIS